MDGMGCDPGEGGYEDRGSRRRECRSLTNEMMSRAVDWRGASAYRTSLRHCRLIRREEKREAS